MAQFAGEIPRLNRLIYASGSIGGNALSRARDLWLIFFYAPPADEPDLPTLVPRLALAGLLLVSRIIEAFFDPLIGYWSDRTQSRWGRRIPFILFATPFYALFAFLIWIPPGEGYGALANAAYFFLILLAFNFFGTLSGGPFESLLPEIAPASRDRVSIVTWQVLFGAVGAVIGLVASGLIKDAFGFHVMGLVVATIALVVRYFALGGAWPHVKREVEPVRLALWEAFRSTFRNDQFLFFLPTFVLFNMAIMMLTASLPFYAEAVILGEGPVSINLAGFSVEFREEGALASLFTGVAIAVVFISLPFVYRLAVRRGKAWVYSTAMMVGAVYLPFLFFMGFLPGIPKLAQTLVFVAGMGLPMAAVFTFPNAIMADIIDYDAVRTGMRREAIYYGTQNTIEKIAAALFAPILAGLLLLGETAADPLGIRLVGPVAGAATLLGFLCFLGYRLPDTVTAETVALREERPKVSR